jgi:hypothetical protein
VPAARAWRDFLRCPDCGERLHNVWLNGEDVWYCQRAIGEEAYEREWEVRYIPQPSPHKKVIPWRATDAPLAHQLEDMGPLYGPLEERNIA